MVPERIELSLPNRGAAVLQTACETTRINTEKKGPITVGPFTLRKILVGACITVQPPQEKDGSDGARSHNRSVKSRMLFQLSYGPKNGRFSTAPERLELSTSKLTAWHSAIELWRNRHTGRGGVEPPHK